MLARDFTMHVYKLQDAPEDAAAVGGKAAGLSRLSRASHAVPPGFVVTAAGFRAFMAHNQLERFETDTAALERFGSCVWPPELRGEIERSFSELRGEIGETPVAVRSSATAEDGASASFAGQHLTLLNVHGEPEMLRGILECWASLYGAAALHYRETKDIEDEAPAMAVVVQALVPAEASGVAFTLDPVSGTRDVVMIEGAWGLGEGVVAGIVTPDHLVVRKSDWAVVTHDVSVKERRVLPAPGGGTIIEELSGELARAQVLTDEQAAELARLATQIEEQAGLPQDIEWAMADGKLYILQARPITAGLSSAPIPPIAGGAAVEAPPNVATAPVSAPPVEPELPAESWVSEFDTDSDPETIWTAANVQEVLPGQISPFNLSFTIPMMNEIGDKPLRQMGLRVKTKDPFSAYFYGRPFLNVTLSLEMIDQTPFSNSEGFIEQFYGQGRDQATDVVIPPVVKKFSFGRLWRYLVVGPRALWFMLRMPAEVRKAERTVSKIEEKDAALLEALSDEELIATLDRDVSDSVDVGVVHVSGAGLTGAMFEGLRQNTKNWLGDENGSLHNRLCTGLATLESAMPALDLWDLSRMVLNSVPLQQAFAPANGTEIEERLTALSSPDAFHFRERLHEFLSRHGHRSVMEAEISAKSWEEDLPTVLSMVRNYLHAGEPADPRRSQERQRIEREHATAEALAGLSWWRKPIFRFSLRQAQNGVISREHTKEMFVRAIDRGRRVSRHVAERLAGSGLIDSIWDMYFLTWDETKALLRGETTRDEAATLIARRREEEQRNTRVVLPETFKGRPKPLTLEQQRLPESQILRGIAVSPGRVTGRARVIIDPRVDATIEPGEILVAPVTDAGWTPLFVAAAAVVVDVGGTLSHGSTVAREYGLPAVVNVKHGTRMIRTGQTITVDGTAGVVILEAGGEKRETGTSQDSA
jgi:pyruvate,water dikinase